MKIRLSMLILTVSALPAFAQMRVCDEECIERKMPFKVCVVENGKSVIKTVCTENPYSVPNSTVYKPPVPLQFCYDYGTVPSWLKGYHIEARDPVTGNYYRVMSAEPNVIENDLNLASAFWWLSCKLEGQTFTDPGNDKRNCCIKVQWSTEGDDPRVNSQTEGSVPVGRTSTKGVTENSCDGTDCSKSYIILNISQNIRKDGFDEDGTPYTFFFNSALGGYGKLPESMRDEYHYYNLFNVIQHEIGHWYGFGHPEDVPCLDDYDGIMEVVDDKYDTEEHQDDERLTEDDKCMFRKLYCCAQTVDVEEHVMAEAHFNIYPNPAYGEEVQIRFLENSIPKGKLIEIINPNGSVALSKRLPAGIDSDAINIAGLANGSYIIKISFDGDRHTIMNKIIVNR